MRPPHTLRGDEDNMKIYDKLRYTRKHRKVTRNKLAEHLGISTSYLGHIELGIRELKPALLNKAAKFLNIPIGFYLSDTTETLEEYNATLIHVDTSRYSEFLKVIDLAIDSEVSVEEFELYSKLRRTIRKAGENDEG